MKVEENASVEEPQTEDVAVAKEEVASTVLGKFKDVSALARAYESLEAEFTRRSQRLRSLEKEVENFKREEASGAEKLRKNASAHRAAAKEFDEFVQSVEGKPNLLEETPLSPSETGALTESALQEDAQTAGGGETQSAQVVGESTVGSTREEPSAEELFTKAFENETVRLRIVGEYLSSLGKSGAPLTGGGVGVVTTPPARAKTVGQAGDMALLYFRKPNLG